MSILEQMGLPSKSGSVNWNNYRGNNNYHWGYATCAILACFGSVKFCFRLNLAWSCVLTAFSSRGATWGSWSARQGLVSCKSLCSLQCEPKCRKWGWLRDFLQNWLSPGSKYRTNGDLFPFSVRWNSLSQKPLISVGVLHRGQVKIKFVLQNLLVGMVVFGSNYLVVYLY